MTEKEKAIRNFAKAMRSADTKHMALFGIFTSNMAASWYRYIEAVKKEYGHVRER